ncbi:unnamed protein product [Schistocephalus solidus]|uniref:LisH domain-containing protein n=1 Tax=Schistocephalus solidus TaxID=70667 RepID=A0A183TP81_SCHSO|nr:unnamed protein product [Schistocephalus solidus]
MLGNLFDGDISALPPQECQRLDFLVRLVASETSDQQKRNYNFLLKNVSRDKRPIDVAVNFLYSFGFSYKIAEAKRLSSRSKNPPILVTLVSTIEVDSIFAQRGRISRYLEDAKCFLCRDLTPMERRNVSPLLHRSSASQSIIHKSGHGYANHNETIQQSPIVPGSKTLTSTPALLSTNPLTPSSSRIGISNAVAISHVLVRSSTRDKHILDLIFTNDIAPLFVDFKQGLFQNMSLINNFLDSLEWQNLFSMNDAARLCDFVSVVSNNILELVPTKRVKPYVTESSYVTFFCHD